MNQAKVNEIFRRFAKANSNPKGELGYVNHFTLLIAVVLGFSRIWTMRTEAPN